MHKLFYGEETVFSEKKDVSNEFVFLLPEYLPGISRIVKTEATVEKCEVREDTSNSAELSLSISVIYISDFGGKIKNAVFRENISINFDNRIPSDGNLTLLASAHISSIAAKLESPRRINAVCSCCVAISCLRPSECEMPDSENSESICVLKNKSEICRKITLPEYRFESEAEITIESESNAIGEIIHADAVFCEAECSCRQEKIDFEGRFMLHILYEISSDSDNEESLYAVETKSVTVKDTISNDAIKEGMPCYIRLNALSAEPSVSFDSRGESRVISLKLIYSAGAVIYEKSDVEIISDAFSEKFDSNPQFINISTHQIMEKICDTVHLAQQLKVDIKELSGISDCKAEILSFSTEHIDGKLFAAARCRLDILGTNTQGELYAIDSYFTLHIPIHSESTEDTYTVPEIFLSIKNCNAKIKEGELLAEFEIRINGVLLSRTQNKVVTELEINTAQPKVSSKGEVIICYPQSDDSLWDIAKKYSVNPEVIQQANALENGDISARHTILIP